MSSTMKRGAALAAVCLAALSVAACGQSDGKNGNPLANVVAAAGGQSVEEKFSAYTDGFNQLIDDFSGVSANFDRYQKLNIPNASPNGSFSFPENITTLEAALEKLKEGRALRGGSAGAAADAAADKVIAQGGALLAQWKELDPYYEARTYREDGLAKGKAAHPALMTAYEGTLSSITELDAALSQFLRARDAERIEKYRKAGHTDAANVINAMQIADHFSSAVIEKNVVEADRLLPSLEAALAELRKSEQAMTADAANKTEFSQISGNLNSMVGAWRDYKQKPDDSDRERIIDQYNSAVEQMNDVEFPA